MKIGTLAVITKRFSYGSWNCWQTNQKIFTGTESPFPCIAVQSFSEKEYHGQLCETVTIPNANVDGHLFVYVYALGAYTDMYMNMLDVVMEP